MSRGHEVAVPDAASVDLEACLVQVEASKSWFRRRVLPLSIEQLRWRPQAHRWSVAECLDHLNLTVDLYLPKIDDAIVRSGTKKGMASQCARCDVAEIEALQRFEPPVAIEVPAPAATMPSAAVEPDGLVDHFHQTRERYANAVIRAAGLDLVCIRVVEPVYPLIVSLGGTLALIAAHDRRHMWQAERVIQSARFPRVLF